MNASHSIGPKVLIIHYRLLYYSSVKSIISVDTYIITYQFDKDKLYFVRFWCRLKDSKTCLIEYVVLQEEAE